MSRIINPTYPSIIHNTDESERRGCEANTSSLGIRLWDVVQRTYDLGFTAFGGPPVHFQILHRRFVDGMGKIPWISEQTYQELFAVTQALPGPASTKMIFSIAQIHAGLLPASFAFLLWSLPGAAIMYGLSLGVQQMDEVLPTVVYALLSGLNAATVGVIALSAVQLSRKAISDQLTRLLVVFGGCAGLCYNSLWYFPVLIIIGGLTTLCWDFRGWISSRRRPLHSSAEEDPLLPTVPASDIRNFGTIDHSRKQSLSSSSNYTVEFFEGDLEQPLSVQSSHIEIYAHAIPVKTGCVMITAFFIVFVSLMILRAVLIPSPLLLSLFNSMFLAGTVIFGGGPVVIPLLREYVVVPGWVSSRDFLLGLAIIQSLPGPNFNFAVYLGALTVAGASTLQVPTIVGAFLAFIGIFIPGLWLAVGFQSIWKVLRTRRDVVSIIRGINATAVGLVFTAVYRLWEIGYLSPEESRGTSLGWQPWWLVIASTTYTVVEWYSVPPAAAIIMGGVAGLAWHGVRQASIA